MTVSNIANACKRKVIYVELSNGFFVRTSLKYFLLTIRSMKNHFGSLDKIVTFETHGDFIFFKFKSGDGVTEQL